MRTIAATELEQHGLGVVEEALAEGPLRVLKHDRPWFVIMSETEYQLLMEDQAEAGLARVQESLADIAAGCVRRVTAVELAAELDSPISDPE